MQPDIVPWTTQHFRQCYPMISILPVSAVTRVTVGLICLFLLFSRRPVDPWSVVSQQGSVVEPLDFTANARMGARTTKAMNRHVKHDQTYMPTTLDRMQSPILKVISTLWGCICRILQQTSAVPRLQSSTSNTEPIWFESRARHVYSRRDCSMPVGAELIKPPTVLRVTWAFNWTLNWPWSDTSHAW